MKLWVLMLIAILAGLILGLSINWYIPVSMSSYMAIIILAALDSVFGAYKAMLDKKFNMHIFITGLVGNALIAAGLTFIGKKLDVDLYLAAVIVFGTRLFTNFATIRRHFLDGWVKKSHKDEEN